MQLIIASNAANGPHSPEPNSTNWRRCSIEHGTRTYSCAKRSRSKSICPSHECRQVCHHRERLLVRLQLAAYFLGFFVGRFFGFCLFHCRRNCPVQEQSRAILAPNGFIDAASRNEYSWMHFQLDFRASLQIEWDGTVCGGCAVLMLHSCRGRYDEWCRHRRISIQEHVFTNVTPHNKKKRPTKCAIVVYHFDLLYPFICFASFVWATPCAVGSCFFSLSRLVCVPLLKRVMSAHILQSKFMWMCLVVPLLVWITQLAAFRFLSIAPYVLETGTTTSATTATTTELPNNRKARS